MGMVVAEHENELTVLVERERAIREHETKKREGGIGLGWWRVSSGSCNGDVGRKSWHLRNQRYHQKISKSGYGSVSSVI
jgi:hypothetical protein